MPAKSRHGPLRQARGRHPSLRMPGQKFIGHVFQQYQHRAAAPRIWRRFAERQHFRALGQPVPHAGFQYPFTASCLPSLAVDYAHMAQAVLGRIAQEFQQQFACRITVETVQVEAVLHWPLPAPQLAQNHARYSGAQEFGERCVARAVVGQGILNLRRFEFVNGAG